MNGYAPELAGTFLTHGAGCCSASSKGAAMLTTSDNEALFLFRLF